MEAREIVGFVKMIKSFPALYNSTLPEYCDKDLIDSQWKRVAKAHRVTVSQAKEKWRNIRNGYARSLKPFPDSNKPRKPYYLSKEVNFLTPFLKLQGNVTKNMSDAEDNDNDMTDEKYDQDDIYFEEITDEVRVKRRESSESDSQENSIEPLLTEHVMDKQKKSTKRNFSDHWNEPETHISVEAYEHFDEPTHSKRAKTVTNHREMFLLSLLPELAKLSDEQMLSFKVKVLTMLSMMLTKDSLDVNTNN